MPSRRVSWANSGNQVTLQADQGGALDNAFSAANAGALMATLSCNCPACAAMVAHSGAGGNTPGSYATTPTDDAYRYVAQAPTPLTGGSGGSVAALMAGSKWSSV